MFYFSTRNVPEPEYMNVVTGYKVFHSTQPFHVKYNNGVLPELKIAYETWGELNEAKDNAVLISTGLSANSHARSQPVSGKMSHQMSLKLIYVTVYIVYIVLWWSGFPPRLPLTKVRQATKTVPMNRPTV